MGAVELLNLPKVDLKTHHESQNKPIKEHVKAPKLLNKSGLWMAAFLSIILGLNFLMIGIM